MIWLLWWISENFDRLIEKLLENLMDIEFILNNLLYIFNEFISLKTDLDLYHEILKENRRPLIY